MIPWLARMIQSIRSDPAAAFCTETLAREHGVSSSALIRAFKQKTGLSPLRFRAALRIEEAKRRLLDANDSVTSISLDVGYNSFGTFVRTFTAMVGLPPTRFRQLARSRTDGDISNIPEAAGYSRPDPRDSVTIVCSVENDLDGFDLLAAGLFPQAVPAGWPLDGCLAFPGQALELRCPRSCRRVTLLVAAVASESLQGAIWTIGAVSPLVYARCLDIRRLGGEIVALDIRLRRILVTDPPFLMPIPLLMAVQARRSINPAQAEIP